MLLWTMNCVVINALWVSFLLHKGSKHIEGCKLWLFLRCPFCTQMLLACYRGIKKCGSGFCWHFHHFLLCTIKRVKMQHSLKTVEGLTAWIVCLCCDAISGRDEVTSNSRMVGDEWIGWDVEGSSPGLTGVLSRYLRTGTEENQEIFQDSRCSW